MTSVILVPVAYRVLMFNCIPFYRYYLALNKQTGTCSVTVQMSML